MSRHPSTVRRRRRAAVRVLIGTAAFALVVTAGATGVAGLLDRSDHPRVVRCAAADAGTEWYLEPDQADTAALLSATSLRRGMPARAATIAIATGLQESKLRNIDYGDRDSVGIFQQRPSQGWGSVEQILDPVYSTNTFYDALQEVDGYQDMEITVAAQTVQRSGFPEAYAQHEPRSRAWASVLTGWSPAALTCTLPEPDGVGDPAAVVARLDRDFGGLATAVDEDGALTIDTTGLAGAQPPRAGWAVAHWAVAVAGTLQVEQVRHADQVWDRTAGQWSRVEGEPLPEGQVRVSLARA